MSALMAVGFLLLVVLLTYSPALDGKFLWDDDAHVTAPSLRSVTGLWKIWANQQATQPNYPRTSAFWLAQRLWDENTDNIANIVLHVGFDRAAVANPHLPCGAGCLARRGDLRAASRPCRIGGVD